MKRIPLSVLALSVLVATAPAPAVFAGVPATPLLPDLFAWEDASRGYMHNGTFDTTTQPGRALYRFTAAIPNIGDGPFEVFEVTHPNNTQDVFQNVHDSFGGVTQTLMGSFPDADPAFGHLFLVGLAQYNLREVLPGNGVGDVVASHDKTSFGLVDSVAFDTSLPGAPPARVYNSANSNPLGVSVGWADLYTSTLPGQWIDATGLPDGQYWLEVIIDPNNFVQETDDTTNTTRVLVDLTIPSIGIPGDLDGDGFVGIVDLGVVLSSWNLNVPPGNPLADPTGDGFIGIEDLNVVLGNWNAGIPPPPGEVSANIPEPGALGVLGLMCLSSGVIGRHGLGGGTVSP